MSCAARYSETTSLEFILNPFKFFFTDYVAKIAPCAPPYIPHLETPIRPPTIFHSHCRVSCVLRTPANHDSLAIHRAALSVALPFCSIARPYSVIPLDIVAMPLTCAGCIASPCYCTIAHPVPAPSLAARTIAVRARTLRLRKRGCRSRLRCRAYRPQRTRRPSGVPRCEAVTYPGFVCVPFAHRSRTVCAPCARRRDTLSHCPLQAIRHLAMSLVPHRPRPRYDANRCMTGSRPRIARPS